MLPLLDEIHCWLLWQRDRQADRRTYTHRETNSIVHDCTAGVGTLVDKQMGPTQTERAVSVVGRRFVGLLSWLACCLHATTAGRPAGGRCRWGRQTTFHSFPNLWVDVRRCYQHAADTHTSPPLSRRRDPSQHRPAAALALCRCAELGVLHHHHHHQQQQQHSTNTINIESSIHTSVLVKEKNKIHTSLQGAPLKIIQTKFYYKLYKL